MEKQVYVARAKPNLEAAAEYSRREVNFINKLTVSTMRPFKEWLRSLHVALALKGVI